MRSALMRSDHLRALVSYARANDVALQAYSELERLQPAILDLDPEIAAHARHMRRRAALIASAHTELSALAVSSGHPVAIMKGVGTARFYPSGWIRVQLDIDAFVSDLDGLFALWPKLLSAGYAHEVVAMRYGPDADLQMSIAFVRQGDRPGRVEVWMGSQPTSWWSAKPIDDDFWKRARPAPEFPGLWYPAPADALATLTGEVNERRQIRLRDVFDFCSIAERLDEDAWHNCRESIRRVLPHAYDALLEEARRQRGLPWPPKWPMLTLREAILPRELPTPPDPVDYVSGIAALRAGKFVPFVPVSDFSAPIAVAETDLGLALRTPFGTFLQK